MRPICCGIGGSGPHSQPEQKLDNAPLGLSRFVDEPDDGEACMGMGRAIVKHQLGVSIMVTVISKAEVICWDERRMFPDK